MKSRNGTLVIIGGREERSGNMHILREIAKRIGNAKICVATVASATASNELWEEYRAAFTQLGLRDISHLSVARRGEASREIASEALAKAEAVFFTGGDQLKITSEIGGTEIEDRIREIYNNGGLIAGTSAGASVMSETMLVSGPGVQSYRLGGGLRMSPGLGLLKGVLIDQHFTERGRIGRLLGALAHNPKYTGIGLDENTAIIVTNRGNRLQVAGAGGAYIVDARQSTDSNISDGDRDTSLSLFNVKVHLLSAGDRYDFETRLPELLPAAAVTSTKRRRPGRRTPKKDRTPRSRGINRSKGIASKDASPRA